MSLGGRGARDVVVAEAGDRAARRAARRLLEADRILRESAASVASRRSASLSSAWRYFRWDDYESLGRRLETTFSRGVRTRRGGCRIPCSIPRGRYAYDRDYCVPISRRESGRSLSSSVVPLLCFGGIVNVAQRFDVISHAVSWNRLVCSPDWAGRGDSGWLREQDDYCQAIDVEQIDSARRFLGASRVAILGSSQGGSAAMRYAAERPRAVRALILNDTGAWIPRSRRRRRARQVARRHVFLTPQDLFRRSEAANRARGAIPESVLYAYGFAQTRRSRSEGGRVYRHDLRALQAYRESARSSLDMWSAWRRVRCPTLLLRGELSDSLSEATCRRMRRESSCDFRVVRVAQAGHTPPLTDPGIVSLVSRWLASPRSVADGTRVCPSRRFLGDRLLIGASS